jgi:hypothetical protein
MAATLAATSCRGLKAMAAREIRRRFDWAQRVMVVDIEDDFGIVTPHTIPLTGDSCVLCGHVMPGGSTNVDLSVAVAVAGVDQTTDDLLAKLANSKNPDVQAVVLAIQLKRAAPTSDTTALPPSNNSTSNA